MAHTRASLDHCPFCERRITDTDPMGCETESGQRYCLNHLPRKADPNLFDDWWAYEAGDARC